MKIECAPAQDFLKGLSDNIVDLTVTSPPYDDLRKYNGYSFPFEEIAAELFRVTKPGGVVVWVVGDQSIDGSESGTSFRQALFFIQLGFKLHDTMIYQRSPSFPSGEHSTRYSQAFEYMFIFSNGNPKTVNLLKDRKNRWAGQGSFGTQSERKKNGELKTRKKNTVNDFGIRFNIWEYATGKGNSTKDDFAFEHPAMFPEKLAADHIHSWSNPGDLVLDPFTCSGTTAKMALEYGRDFLGCDISQEYCDIANRRIAPIISQPKLFQQ